MRRPVCLAVLLPIPRPASRFVTRPVIALCGRTGDAGWVSVHSIRCDVLHKTGGDHETIVAPPLSKRWPTTGQLAGPEYPSRNQKIFEDIRSTINIGAARDTRRNDIGDGLGAFRRCVGV